MQADLAAWGNLRLPDVASAPPAEPFGVYPDNWSAARIFARVSDQFERSPMSGHLLRFDVMAVDLVISRQQLPCDGDDWARLEDIARHYAAAYNARVDEQRP